MSDRASPTDAGGVIPNFFYDVISFILPGGWLVAGALWVWHGQSFAGWFANLKTQSQSSQSILSSAPAIAVLLASDLLLFLGAASLVGFLLASFSHSTVERLWRWRRKLDLNGLARFMGSDDCIKRLVESFDSQFGMQLNEGNLEPASFLCLYFIWRRDVNLGKMTTRIDAERLAAQSFVLVSFLLLIEDLIHAVIGGQLYYSEFVWAACLLLCLLASASAFNYHRKKRLYARFQIYLATVRESEKRLF